MNTSQHWSQVEYLHLTVTNPNICLKGQHSYYSGAWDGPFEEVAVRYLHGDPFSRSRTPAGSRSGISTGSISATMCRLPPG